MTSTPDEAAFAGDGELLTPQWSYKFLDCSQIDAGEMIAPARLDSELARRFAALHLVVDDLSFALDCLTEADKLGVPSSTNLVLRSLIFSGAVAYARCFKDGVRPVRLSPEDFEASAAFDKEVHAYVIALRDKHVAHSVNEFERCVTTAVMVGRPDTRWDGRGIGVIFQKSLGMSRRLLRGAMVHIKSLKGHVIADLEALRPQVFEEFRASFREDGRWKMVPILTVADPKKVADRRRD